MENFIREGFDQYLSNLPTQHVHEQVWTSIINDYDICRSLVEVTESLVIIDLRNVRRQGITRTYTD